MNRNFCKLSAILALTLVRPISTNAETYIVKPDDCWSTIAENYNTTNALLSANNDYEDSILAIGRQIIIPVNTMFSNDVISDTNVYYPKKDEGWYTISKNTGIPVSDLLISNNADINTPVIYGEPIKLPNNITNTTLTTSTIYTTTSTIATTTTTTTTTYTLIGTKTLYNTPWGNSWFNITYMASKLDGVVVNPGETFSLYNYPAFPNHCNELDGFKESYAFDGDGNLIKSYGGGICFTSTVFYQCAVLECNLYPVERHNHVNKVGYATTGEDAAVNLDADYVQDMQFMNTTNYPIQFRFTSNNYTGALTASAYKVG